MIKIGGQEIINIALYSHPNTRPVRHSDHHLFKFLFYLLQEIELLSKVIFEPQIVKAKQKNASIIVKSKYA